MDWFREHTGMAYATGESYVRIYNNKYERRADGNYLYRPRSDMYQMPFGMELSYAGGSAQSVKVSMLNVRKERFNSSSPATVYNAWALENTDNPYRYFPMPSSSATVRASVDLGLYEITYKNAYGEGNKIYINVRQELRQNHASGAAGRYRAAQSWKEVEDKALSKGGIFPFAVADPDNAQDDNGKVAVDLGY
jgi:hypothetical protein